jgi:mannosyl-oligosaccharide glucosidase
MNFLAVRALKHYSQETGPHQSTAAQLYQELRQALLSNLVVNYQQTGYIWEQYRDADGKGISSHPFTGWTALVTLVAAGVY